MLRKLGVKISIDDFGIGYSSLSALADITADEIKIDRSFITDIHKRPRSQGILRAIESLSEALGMTVIAEGIESFEELAYLQAATNIRYAQGYYFSRPIFLEELKPAIRTPSEARISLASRPLQESRPVHSRRERYRR
jgi:EAL domain-containing protein (putative c-di-GMP-specific phosphodiesterase class I)